MRHVWEGLDLGLPSDTFDSMRAEIAGHQLTGKSPSWITWEKSRLNDTSQYPSGREQTTETELSALGHVQAVMHSQSLASYF